MRVLLVSGEYPPLHGGVGDYTALLARHLAVQGEQVAVAATAASGSPEQAGCTAVFREVREWNFRGFATVAGIAREWLADVVHIQYQAAAFAMHPAANLSPLLLRSFPLAVTFHDLKVPYLFPKAGPLRQLAVRILASAATACILTNDEDAAAVEAWRWPKIGLTVIPIGSNIARACGVDPSRVRTELGVAGDETLLVYFGFLHPSKGVDILLGALAGLVRRGLKVRLLMLGGSTGDSDRYHSAYERSLYNLINEGGLADRIIWTGYLSEERISAYLQASDIVVLPFREGASLRHGTLLGALAHGLPIITTLPPVKNTRHVLPALVDGASARLVPPGDVESLIEAMGSLARSPDQRSLIGAGSAALGEQFGWPVIAAKHVEIYHRMLGMNDG